MHYRFIEQLTWTQLNTKGFACPEDRVADGHARRLLVHLDGYFICLYSNDLYA